eukprot:1148700-Pelagomonas_calceolata.AAC.2
MPMHGPSHLFGRVDSGGGGNQEPHTAGSSRANLSQSLRQPEVVGGVPPLERASERERRQKVWAKKNEEGIDELALISFVLSVGCYWHPLVTCLAIPMTPAAVLLMARFAAMQATPLDEAILENMAPLPSKLKEEPAKLKKKKVGGCW